VHYVAKRLESRIKAVHRESYSKLLKVERGVEQRLWRKEKVKRR
jgi:hypothetical protein